MIASLLRAGLLALLVLGLSPQIALAHAIVLSSSPALDSQQKGPDIAISVKFNSRIDHARSRLSLVDAANKTIELMLDPSTPVDALVGRATGLTAGRYRIRWQVLAIDGHITRGDIPFTVTGP